MYIIYTTVMMYVHYMYNSYNVCTLYMQLIMYGMMYVHYIDDSMRLRCMSFSRTHKRMRARSGTPTRIYTCAHTVMFPSARASGLFMCFLLAIFVCRALLRECQIFLRECTALLREYMALLREHRANLRECRAF